jgi:flagellar hook-basal body complex protein FliE
MPTPTAAAAANAYASLARLNDPAAGFGRETSGNSAGANFGSILKDVVSAVAEAGRKSDAQAQALATGKANMVDVVTAVAETETAIETLVSVRDKVIAAYEDILKMPI